MLGSIRNHLGSWYAKALFIILAVSFAAWGVGDMTGGGGSDTALAHVAGQRIEVAEVQNAYQNELSRLAQRMPRGQEPTAAMRRLLADQALQELITQAALNAEVKRLGLTVPDSAVRATVFAMPAFHGSNGQFDRSRFDQLIAQNGLTEQHFLSLVRQQIGQEQVMGAVAAGATAPPDLTQALFAYQNETRKAEAVFLPFKAAPAPSAPSEAVLKRWWQNHPKTFSTPEYRKIRVAILSPDLLAKHEKVSEAALKAAYEQAQAEYDKPERRSAEILLASDEAKATALAARWRTGASWTEMQQAAKDAGATAVALEDALPKEFPDPTLARAIFAAGPNDVVGPFQTPLGWHVIDVTGIVPGRNTTFADAEPQLRDKLAREQAANAIESRVTGFEDAVAANPSLDALPGDLGLVGVTGTLDEAGMTPEGQAAPIPGSAALRKEIVAAAFQAKKGEMASVVQGPDGSYYALDLEAVTPPHVRPYDLAREQVLAGWTEHQQKREQNVMATHLMLAVNSGTPLADAARAKGLQATSLPETGRDKPAAGIPPELLRALFQLKPHKATMVETGDGFVAAELTAVDDPSEKSDHAAYALMREQLSRGIGTDLQQAFVQAARMQARPRVNVALLNKIAQP